jgi:hypothetical protein
MLFFKLNNYSDIEYFPTYTYLCEVKKLTFLFIALVAQTFSYATTCTISTTVTASATTCNTLTSGDTMLITGTLILTASHSVQASNDIVFIIDGGSITWNASADLDVGINSTFFIINGGSLLNGSGSCNAAKRISFGGTTVVSCNGGGGGSVSTFTAFTAAGGGTSTGPLPVNLINFEAKIQGGYNILAWSTASEYNNSHFEIQKSIDGINFETIAKRKGAGNSNQVIEYSYSDSAQLISYYRLKQIDFNGSFEYSKVIKVSGRKNITQREVIISPNPSTGKIKIQINIADIQTIQVTLYNKQGAKILTQNTPQYSVANSIITIDLSSLPSDI